MPNVLQRSEQNLVSKAMYTFLDASRLTEHCLQLVPSSVTAGRGELISTSTARTLGASSASCFLPLTAMFVIFVSVASCGKAALPLRPQQWIGNRRASRGGLFASREVTAVTMAGTQTGRPCCSIFSKTLSGSVNLVRFGRCD